MPRPAGLAHVATVSFLAARAAPSGAFWLALTGGAALAREAELRGMREGYAASTAAMLQTVAIVGPLRFSAPLTQALSAPLLGAMHARGRRPAGLVLACLAIRLVNYVAVTAFGLFVLLGPKAYAGSYKAIFGWLSFLPRGLAGALLLTAIFNLAAAAFYSVVQVWVYRRALSGWPAQSPAPVSRPADPSAPSPLAGADPRAALAAATLVTVVLLVSHSWALLGGVAIWLALASILPRQWDRDVFRVGVSLAALLGLGTLAASLIGGLGADQAASRGVRGALLVLVATWLRLAAGSDGLSEAFRRALQRLSRIPGSSRAGEILHELDSGRPLAGSAKALRERLRGVRRDPIVVADAVLDWAAQEASSFPERTPVPAAKLRFSARDAALTASLLLPMSSLAVALG
jgi:hypothetical protein